jgi:cytochrome P450
MWPAIAVNCRAVQQDTRIDRYRVPAGHQLVWVASTVNRDPRCFPQPDSFRPDRWLRCAASPTSACGFSAQSHMSFGPSYRRCVGEQLSNLLIRFFVASLAAEFRWQSDTPAAHVTRKQLPVCKPITGTTITLHPRASAHTSGAARVLPAASAGESRGSTENTAKTAEHR